MGGCTAPVMPWGSFVFRNKSVDNDNETGDADIPIAFVMSHVSAIPLVVRRNVTYLHINCCPKRCRLGIMFYV